MPSFKLKPITIALLATILVIACQNNAVRQPNDLQIANCRTVQHEMGEVCVPLNPQRLISEDQKLLEILLALNLKPVATVEPNLVRSQSSHLAGRLEDIASLGKDSQLNLEKAVQLKPDLILGFAPITNYDQLSQIAPTVALENEHDAWKASLQRVGEILNRSQQAQQELENYQNRVEKLQTAMGERLDKTEVSVVRFYANGRVEFRDSSSFPGSVLEDVGLPRPAVQQKGNNLNSNATYQSVSAERLDLLDGDVIFVAIDAGANERFTEFQQDPLWRKLEAVQNNQVFIVDSGYWIFGNVLAANAILDDLEKYLVDSTSVPPTP